MVTPDTVLIPAPGASSSPGRIRFEGEDHPLSPTAEVVWYELDGHRSLRAVVDVLEERYGPDPDILHDVLRLAAVLLGHGIVVEQRSPPDEPAPTSATTAEQVCWALVAWMRGGPAPLVAPADHDEWHRIVQLVGRNQMTGVLAAALDASGQELGPERRAELARHLGRHAAAAQQIEERLVALHDLLSRAGIEHRVLKGCALSVLDYPSELLRPTGDVDVLVGRDGLLHAAALLEADGATRLGSARTARHDVRFVKAITEVYPQPRVEVDLHAELVAGPFGVWMDSRRCFEQQRTIARRGRELPALSVSDAFVHACYVLLIGNWVLRPLAVLDLLVLADRGPDPDRVWSLAHAWRGEAVVAGACALAADLLPEERDLLDPWRSAPTRAGVQPRLVLRTDSVRSPGSTTRRFRRHVVRELLTFAALPTLGERVAYGESLVLPEHQDRTAAAAAARLRRLAFSLAPARR